MPRRILNGAKWRPSLLARQWTPDSRIDLPRVSCATKDEETPMRRQETALAKVCLVGAVAALLGCGALTAQAQELKHYDSNTKAFWAHPPDDWFLGDETKAQKGQVPNPGQPLPTPAADLEKILAKIQLPQGFKIAVWASGVPQARQMALGDKGTLFVGTFDKGTVNAITDEGG